ncbi:MAG: EAL domain-containing protein [Caenibius sp.]
MAVRKLFRGLGAKSDDGANDAVHIVAADDTARRLEILADYETSAMAWIWATDSDGNIIYMSPGAADKIGRPLEEVLAQPLASVFETDPDNPDERSDRPLKFQISARNKITDLIVRFVRTPQNVNNPPKWWSISGHPKMDKSGNFVGYRGSAKDVTIEYQRKIEDSRLAEYDSLTGLANRHRMSRRLDSILAAYKSAKRSCAVMMLDLDRFKQVNDTMGHQAGDDLLKQVAERVQAVIANRGEIGRLGGDEFQVILPDIDDRGKLGEIAEKLIHIVSQPYPIGDKRAIIGTSIGVAIAPYDGVEQEEIIHASDLALYSAKNGGRGQFRFYSAELKDEREERQILLEDLRDALTNEQLELHYQPVVRTEDSMVIGCEALMRWEHPDRGNIRPDLFIPIAEESTLINQLGEWAIRKACEDAMQWPTSMRVSVNVSATQFANQAFTTIVTNALAASGLEPDRLELELTESVFMGDSEVIDETFTALKTLGVRLALDDFGTGYSSLSYLRSAPFDKIKVDKSFVDSCTQKDKNSEKIIAAIIGLSDALGMETTVEGVEAFDQLEVVKSRGARFIQGWIYAKAMPQTTLLERVANGEIRIEPDGPDQHRPERRSVFRRIGVIHEDHRYDAVMRNLSRTGASIDGLVGVPVETNLVLDLGGGQLAVCSVVRSEDANIAVEFETPLVNDGAGGLVTRHRVSPYALAAAGMPLGALPPGHYPLALNENQRSMPQFMQVAVSRN